MSYTYLPELEHDSEEWHAAREGSLGASEVAAVLGLSRWATPYTVWESKMGVRSNIPENLAYFGHKLEPVIAGWIEAKHPEVGPLAPSISVRSTEFPWLTATPDRMAGDIPVELKTSSQNMKGTWAEGVPDYYRIQSLVQQGILGAPFGWLAVLHGGNEPELHKVEFDAEAWDMITRITGEWWRGHVETRTPPPPSTVQEQSLLWPSTSGKATELSETAFEAFERRNVLLSDIKAMKAEADALEKVLGDYVQDAETLTYEGRSIATYKTQQGRETARVALLREKFPAIAEQVISRGKPFKVLRTIKGDKE